MQAGGLIRDRRMAQGLSQDKLAEAMRELGFSSWRQTTVTKTETAERPLRVNELVALANILNAKIADFVKDSSEPEAALALRELLRARSRHQQAQADLDDAQQLLESAIKKYDSCKQRAG
jgi:transcriptional regulator with XRE-family HTH domain